MKSYFARRAVAPPTLAVDKVKEERSLCPALILLLDHGVDATIRICLFWTLLDSFHAHHSCNTSSRTRWSLSQPSHHRSHLDLEKKQQDLKKHGRALLASWSPIHDALKTNIALQWLLFSLHGIMMTQPKMIPGFTWCTAVFNSVFQRSRYLLESSWSVHLYLSRMRFAITECATFSFSWTKSRAPL